jgi:uncharacterized metal-binding protein YceD (DUF177 family)
LAFRITDYQHIVQEWNAAPAGSAHLQKALPMTEATTPRPTRFRTGGLSPRKPTRFSYVPDKAERAALAEDLGLLGLYQLELTGEIAPSGRDELLLTAQLTARADQACVVTLAPVPAEITEPVRRRYVAGLEEATGEEVQMPEDETLEPMPEEIDLREIAAEALALALPLYPRAPGAEFGQAIHAGEGVQPLADADLKPFAGLADLAERLSGKDKPGSDGDG